MTPAPAASSVPATSTPAVAPYSNGFSWTSAEAAAAEPAPKPTLNEKPVSPAAEAAPGKDVPVTDPASDIPAVQVLMEGGLTDLKRIAQQLNSIGVESQIVMPPGGCNT